MCNSIKKAFVLDAGIGVGADVSTNLGSEGHSHTLNSHQQTVSTLPPYLAVNIWERIG